jgi:hypothetical protein
MISTVFAYAPAGVLGSGSADARPYVSATALPALLAAGAADRGTGVPAAARRVSVAPADQGTSVPAAARCVAVALEMAPRFRGRVAGTTGVPSAPAIRRHTDLITQNDGTTLGIQPPRRPQS